MQHGIHFTRNNRPDRSCCNTYRSEHTGSHLHLSYTVPLVMLKLSVLAVCLVMSAVKIAESTNGPVGPPAPPGPPGPPGGQGPAGAPGDQNVQCPQNGEYYRTVQGNIREKCICMQLPMIPTSYGRSWICLRIGCMASNNEFFQPGSSNGGCKCIEGQDNRIPDLPSLYKWGECQQ